MSQALPLCPDGQPLRLIELSHPCGTKLTLMDWGATWISCKIALQEGEREVLLGCGKLEDFFTQKSYLGATVGRYANRIANSTFTRDGKTYHLTPNQGPHQLHGGPDAYSSRRWKIISQDQQQVVLGIESPDQDQGFPGNLAATVCYRLEEGGRVCMEYKATVDAPCPVNFTNHAYVNLDGAATDVRQHTLMIQGAQYLPIDKDAIPLGALSPVAGTSFDFTKAKRIAQDFLQDDQQKQVKGYDHSWFLDECCRNMQQAAATLVSSDGKLSMDLFTTKPAMQFYSGNFLEGTPAWQGNYASYQGLALETQFLPDSPNHPEWAQEDCWLQPGQTYHHTTVLVFRSK